MLKRAQRSYTAETRQEAAGMAGRKGAMAASQEMGTPLDTLRARVSRAKNGNLAAPTIMPPETRKALAQADRTKGLGQENRRLRTEAIQLKQRASNIGRRQNFFRRPEATKV